MNYDSEKANKHESELIKSKQLLELQTSGFQLGYNAKGALQSSRFTHAEKRPGLLKFMQKTRKLQKEVKAWQL
jgi:hypothetical protein